jgi:hypothetical protein
MVVARDVGRERPRPVGSWPLTLGTAFSAPDLRLGFEAGELISFCPESLKREAGSVVVLTDAASPSHLCSMAARRPIARRPTGVRLVFHPPFPCVDQARSPAC